jgi:hypothetical protein
MLGSLQCPLAFAFELAPTLDLRLSLREFLTHAVGKLAKSSVHYASLPQPSCSCIAKSTGPLNAVERYFLSTVRRRERIAAPRRFIRYFYFIQSLL